MSLQVLLPMAMIEFQNVTKRFGKQAAVNRVSLQVESGAVAVLVGPSGCGKTTILRLIAGLECPTEGEIRIDGTVVNQTAPKDRQVAMVFQNFVLYPHLSVRQNLEFALSVKKIAKSIVLQEVERIATLLEITSLLDRMPGELSGGQQQRVAIGRALIRKPKVLLLDEPFSNLDTRLRMALRTELLQLHRQFETTMVYVTHDPAEAMMMATELFVMRDGMIEQAGKPAQLYRSPDNRFVAESIGWPAMSFISGSSLQGADSKLSVLERIAAGHLPSQQVAAIARNELMLGVRASQWHASRLGEKLAEEHADRHSQVAFEAVVDLVLPLGEKDLLETIVGADKVQVLVDPGQFRPGDRLTLAVNLASIQLFDRKTGKAIRENW